MVKDLSKYDLLLNACNGYDRDWEIVWWSFDKVKVPILDVVSKVGSSRRKMIYIELYKRGVVFPPLIVNEEGYLLDGWHRWYAQRELNKKKVLVMHSLGKGRGLIKKDEFFAKKKGEFILPYKDIPWDSYVTCLVCKKRLSYLPLHGTAGPMPEFPDGMPSGPYFYCKPCGIIMDRDAFLIWQK